MIGSYDFCGHYEWTFAWLENKGGKALLESYWAEAIATDSQSHAAQLIRNEGFAGMMEYWGHTLAEESPNAAYHMTRGDGVVRCDMHECPSKGFLLRNGLEQHRDYCDHCIGWIAPVMEKAGYCVEHEHNHRGQCWWEFRRKDDPSLAPCPGKLSGQRDVRLLASWAGGTHDVFGRAEAQPRPPSVEPGSPG